VEQIGPEFALKQHSRYKIMYSEIYRPSHLSEIVGNTEAKTILENYLTKEPFTKAVFLTGSPGIGKTTMALCSATTFGFDPLEINASKSIRSFEDVDKIRDSTRSSVNILSFLNGNTKRKTCVILDEVDGSDPHAQNKIIDWIRDPNRVVPILCTGNELPTVFKRNSDYIDIVKCFPPRPQDIQKLFPSEDVPTLLKDCQYDIRRMIHRIQYGVSDTIPKYVSPPKNLAPELMFILKQKSFGLDDPLSEYHAGKRDISRLTETIGKYTSDGKRVRNAGSSRRLKKPVPDK